MQLAAEGVQAWPQLPTGFAHNALVRLVDVLTGSAVADAQHAGARAVAHRIWRAGANDIRVWALETFAKRVTAVGIEVGERLALPANKCQPINAPKTCELATTRRNAGNAAEAALHWAMEQCVQGGNQGCATR